MEKENIVTIVAPMGDMNKIIWVRVGSAKLSKDLRWILLHIEGRIYSLNVEDTFALCVGHEQFIDVSMLNPDLQKKEDASTTT